MDKEALKSNLNGLERKISLLLHAHHAQKEAMIKVQSENNELRALLKNRDEQLENFKNQIKITKIAEHINPNDKDVMELKRKVDEYIREIDKCIAQANH